MTALITCAGTASAIRVPQGFAVESVVPSNQFDTPTAIAFMPDGRLLVAEKSGLLWPVTNGVRAATPLWDGRMEVLDQHDRGFLGLAVDPRYLQNHYVYMMYTVDPDSNGIDDEAESFGRIVRYQVSFTDSTRFAPNSRTVLLGTDWAHGPLIASPSHTIGALRFGNDGMLLATMGDGAQFDYVDTGGHNPNAFLPGRSAPAEDIGAYRAQMITSLCGKLLRLDPSNGHGLPSNPFWDGDPLSVRSRVYSYGLRNPFRFTVRPGTGNANPAAGKPGQLVIGDVGWYTYEEHNIANHGGDNFGWPCLEGLYPTDQYKALPPAESWICDSLGKSINPATSFTMATVITHHNFFTLSVPQFGIGNTALGGSFYKGTLYPTQYREKYFLIDFGQNYIKLCNIDTTGTLLSLDDFADQVEGPVDMAVDPYTGDLVYVSIYTGQIRRIRWVGGSGGGNLPPVVRAKGLPDVGVAPLTVNFSSAGTYDSNGDTLSFSWNFGDGSGSPLANPSHVYTIPGNYTATLTVDDRHGGVTSVSMIISVAESANFPTTAVLDNFNRPNGPIGGLWTGDISGLQIVSGQLQQISLSNSLVLGTAPFGPTQEAFVRIARMTPNAPEHNLMLKVQGLTWDAGHIEVRFDGQQNGIIISTYSPNQSWVQRSSLIPATLQDGDQLGARAYPSGLVVVYKNGVQLGSGDCSGWDFNANGGRLGLTITGASSSLIDDFGGGDAVLNSNTPPSVQIQRADTTFAVAGDSLDFTALVHDNQDANSALTYRWDIDIQHNNHVHPSVHTATTPDCKYVMINHDDGTGCYFVWKLKVTDTGNLTTRDSVYVFPEIDLTPSPLTLTPQNPVNSQATAVSFRERNRGRMPSHYHHWMLLLDGGIAAQGDTLEAGSDSVAFVWTSSAPLSAGNHVARVVLDTLSNAGLSSPNVETDETNNATTLSFSVAATLAVGDGAPRELALSNAWPNPAQGRASFTLELPQASMIELAVHDLQGRAVWRQAARSLGAGRWTLDWPGTDASGSRAAAGVYLARVRVDGQEFTRRFVLLK